MKIGFDAKRLFNNFTGLGNYSRFIVNALHENDSSHEYVLYSPKVRTHPDTLYFFNQKNIQLRSPQGIQAKWGGIWRSYSLGNIAAREGVELFHGLSNELPLIKPAQLKTVVTLHDVIYRRYPQFYKPIDRIIYDWKFRNACINADCIVAVSQQTAADAIEFLHADPAKVSVIYQGCHPIFKADYSIEQLTAIKQKYQLPDEFVLNVGTIESRKNALLILKALLISKEKIPLVIVGRATAYQKELQHFIITHQISKQVIFIHTASFLELPLIYRAATLFVYPSVFEGFGIPIVEAIASGLPVITSKGSCFAEAGGPDCVYVDPTQPEELAHAISKTLNDNTLTKLSVEKSKNYIQRFEPNVIAGELMQLYRKLV